MERVLKAIVLVIGISVMAEDIYVGQIAAGSDDGSSPSNRHSMVWLNTSTNWASGAGKVSPGDSVRMVGTLTSTLVMQTSGSSGNPITVKMESGSKFSKGTWYQSGANGDAAIYGTGKGYLNFQGQGGTVVDFETTANGSNLANTNQSVGIWMEACNNIYAFNLCATNMYRRTPNSSEDNEFGCGIRFNTSANVVTVSNCFLSQGNAPLVVSMGAGDSNIFILNNWMSDAGEGGLVLATGSAGVTNVIISGNTVIHNDTWSGSAGNAIHQNCMHLFAVAGSSSIYGMKVFGNTFQGVSGTNMTGYLFLEGYIYSPKVYNNLFHPQGSGYGGNGYLTLKGAQGALVANNTFIGFSGVGTGIGTTGFGGGIDNGQVVTNNLMINLGTFVADPTVSIAACDYNCYYPDSSSAFSGFRTFAQWQAAFGFDAHGKIQNPSLDSNFVPNVGDTAARNSGVNLTSLGITSDFYGLSRPGSGAWTLGAFEGGSSTTTRNISAQSVRANAATVGN